MSDEGIDQASVSQLIQAIKETKKYAFLIGAGTSRPKPAEVPTGGELIDMWRKDCPDLDNFDKEFDEWINSREETMNNN